VAPVGDRAAFTDRHVRLRRTEVVRASLFSEAPGAAPWKSWPG
jgi:hypothetical protein